MMGHTLPLKHYEDGNIGKCPKHLPNEESTHNAWRTNYYNDLTFVVNCFDNSIGAGKIV